MGAEALDPNQFIADNLGDNEVAAATLGLASFDVVLTSAAEMDAAAVRLDNSGIAYDREGDSLSVADPWGNSVRLTVAGM
jgi:catechol-2,3-dioxygenase